MGMGRPIIGITGELEAARWGNWIREAVVSPVSYTRAVERAGGTPIVLPPIPANSVPGLTAVLDGLLLTGGRDVDPSLYDEEPHADTDTPDHRRESCTPANNLSLHPTRPACPSPSTRSRDSTRGARSER